MRKKKNHVLLFAATFLFFAGAGCRAMDHFGGREQQDEHEDHDEQEGHDEHEGQDEHEGHEHSSPSHDPGALERLRAQQCEHEVPILDCDECRYEVGAVEVAASLLDPNGDDLVRTTTLSARVEKRALELTGEVSFDERRVAHVSPRVGGVIRQVFVSLGDEVAQGDQLIAMDSLELGQLRSRYLQSKARVELAERNFERSERLYERRIASGREKLQAETTLREARIELESAQQQLRLLGSGSRGGHGGGTVLTAPMPGKVVAMHAVNGERATPEVSVITIADLSSLWVWADLYERDLGPLVAAAEGTKLSAAVEVAAFPDRRFKGVVDYVGSVMDETTRTIKVRIEVDNDGLLLRPGMFANVSLDLGEGSAAFVLPAESVMEHEGQTFLFVKVGPTRFLRRDVVTRPATGGEVAIVRGVELGEEVVVRGAFLLKSDVLREQMGAGCAH